MNYDNKRLASPKEPDTPETLQKKRIAKEKEDKRKKKAALKLGFGIWIACSLSAILTGNIIKGSYALFIVLELISFGGFIYGLYGWFRKR